VIGYPSGQDGAILPPPGLPAVSRMENFLESHIINPLVTKLVWSRWLDIGIVLRSGEKQSTSSRVFPYTSFVLYRFLRALQQNRAQSRLLYLLIVLFVTVSRHAIYHDNMSNTLADQSQF